MMESTSQSNRSRRSSTRPTAKASAPERGAAVVKTGTKKTGAVPTPGLTRSDMNEAEVAVRIEQAIFEVGDNAVYPAHGVTRVKRIDERVVGGMKKRFYVLEVVESQMTIMVPTDNADTVGLRRIISTDEVNRVYGILKERDVKIDQTTWNRRYREYMEKIKTGSVYEIAEVLRNLFLLRYSKDLSFGERKMLDQAKALLVKEISLAKSEDEIAIEQEIQAIFAS